MRKEAVAKGLITRAEIDSVLARLEARDFEVFSPVMFTAWGRAPECAPKKLNFHVRQHIAIRLTDVQAMKLRLRSGQTVRAKNPSTMLQASISK